MGAYIIDGEAASAVGGLAGLYDHYHEFICTGIYLTQYLVLTAGHCCYSQEELIIVSGNVALSKSQVVRISDQIILHPFYAASGYKFDLCKIRLSVPNLDIAVVPTLGLRTPLPHSEVQYFGWGRTHVNGTNSDILQTARSTIVSNANCQKAWTTTAVIEDYNFCVAAQTNSPCYGDSGGPIFDANHTLIGISSTGEPNCRVPGRPQIVSDLTFLIVFILN